MKRIWIVVAGVLALTVTLALAVVGVTPDGGHTWLDSIQTAMKSAIGGGSHPTGGHTWLD